MSSSPGCRQVPTSVPANWSPAARGTALVLLLAMATVSGVPDIQAMGTLIDQPLGLMTVAVRSAASIWAGVIEPHRRNRSCWQRRRAISRTLP